MVEPHDLTVEPHDLVARFRTAAGNAPDLTAVHGPDGRLTFAQLEDRTARLAGRLRAAGVGRGHRVGVSVRRGVDWVAVPLAVWRVGAAYVPLDPAYPADRLALLRDDADLSALVSDHGRPSWAGDLPVLAPSEPSEPSETSGLSAPGDDTPVSALDPAYVIYTSGSTGRPKGVEVTRGGTAALVAGLEERGVYPPRHQVVGWNASLSFDASVQQWVRVCRGDTVVVLGEEDRTEPERLATLLAEHAVTVMDSTPSHWSLLGPHLAGGRALQLLLGGEPVPRPLWEELAGCDQVDAWNLYGPTECAVDATAVRITGDTPHLGHPLPAVRAYILDAALRPATIGELYLAGPGLATGYAGRPGPTADRFVADPFAADGTRMYRTGDEVRRRADHTLEFLGRADRQMKVRGFRVEPGEAESRLLAHPSLAAAVATVRTGPDGDARFAAYYVPRPDAEVTDEELRAHCAAALPAHLTPSVFIRLDTLPLTPNGKVDYQALHPLPSTAATPGRAPEGELERLIADVWAEVLGRDAVHADDDFFALGGHSLIALKVVARLKRTAGVVLPTKDVYRYPRLHDLARHAELVRAGRDA
ncbi:non-ribosomal peptide synthetase [Streptomyces violaceusniger]|uniref:non-ribosomal peptide synthetase n=1 Tax=Streptomyces violaceusniger TaxID=68280 RepID=UPI00344273AA